MDKSYTVMYETTNTLQKQHFTDLLEMWRFVLNIKELDYVKGIWVDTHQQVFERKD